jgi:hypothetical protein
MFEQGNKVTLMKGNRKIEQRGPLGNTLSQKDDSHFTCWCWRTLSLPYQHIQYNKNKPVHHHSGGRRRRGVRPPSFWNSVGGEQKSLNNINFETKRTGYGASENPSIQHEERTNNTTTRAEIAGRCIVVVVISWQCVINFIFIHSLILGFGDVANLRSQKTEHTL